MSDREEDGGVRESYSNLGEMWCGEEGEVREQC